MRALRALPYSSCFIFFMWIARAPLPRPRAASYCAALCTANCNWNCAGMHAAWPRCACPSTKSCLGGALGASVYSPRPCWLPPCWDQRSKIKEQQTTEQARSRSLASPRSSYSCSCSEDHGMQELVVADPISIRIVSAVQLAEFQVGHGAVDVFQNLHGSAHVGCQGGA